MNGLAKGRLSKRNGKKCGCRTDSKFKRPLKSRLELDFNGQTAVQLYDGVKGGNAAYLGRTSGNPIAADELRQAATERY